MQLLEMLIPPEEEVKWHPHRGRDPERLGMEFLSRQQ